MFCKKVVSRGHWRLECSEVESRSFEEVAVMAGRVSAVREVKGLPVDYSRIPATPLLVLYNEEFLS